MFCIYITLISHEKNKMKIGILTYHRAHNYGAVLQAFALQEKLKALGHTVEIIDYSPNYLINPYKILSFNRLLTKSPIIIVKNLLNIIVTFRRRLIRHKRFNHFINKYLVISEKVTSVIPPMYDIYILGSDQIWNSKISSGFDKIFFGYFTTKKNALKITYAASMEANNLSNGENVFFENALRNFNGISVRESNLSVLLQPLTSKIVKNVLDPTFIVDRLIWDNLAIKPKIAKKYVLVYDVRINDQTLILAHKIAKEIDGVVVQLTAWIRSSYVKHRYQCASPKEFVGWIKYADCIVTSSFHGTAFSIIYNLPFYTIKLNDGADSRSELLLKNLDLSNRLISTESNIHFTNIDYSNPNNLLEELKKESLYYLSNFIK